MRSVKLYTPTGCLLPTSTGISQWKRLGLLAAHDREELLLQLLGNRANHALAHLDLIHRADGRNLSRRAGKEDFIGDVEHFARNLCSTTGMPRSCAICNTESRVIPGSTRIAQGRGVSTPLCTTKMFSPDPSLT